MLARTITLVLAGICLSLAGCAGAARVPDARPSDFTLDALVTNPHATDVSLPRFRRPARYDVDADGELRVAVGAGVSEETIPRRTRTLDPAQLDRIWLLVTGAGLTDPDSAYAIDWGRTWEGPRGEPTAVISVTRGGRRVHSGVPLGASSGLGAPRVEALLDELAGLAWIPERE